MILINLLPHRELRRQRRKAAFFAGLGLSALAGVAVVVLWLTVVTQLTSAQSDRNQFLTSEIKKLEAQIKSIASLREEIEALKARQRAVEDLQTNRNVPVYMLNELAKLTPEGIYLTTLRQTDVNLTVVGVAQSNERVSDFLRAMSHDAVWLVKPELVEIKAVAAQGPNREARRLYEFSMRLTIKRPTDTAAAAAIPVAAPNRAPKG